MASRRTSKSSRLRTVGTPSRVSSRSLSPSLLPAYPVRAPELPTTRWQGTTMGNGLSRVKAHSRREQTMRRSIGNLSLGISRNDSFENFSPHQGHSSSGIGEARVLPVWK